MPIDVEYLQDGTFVRAVGRGVVTEEDYRSFIVGANDSEDRLRRYRCVLCWL